MYSDDENVRILVALLKAHGVRYVIASPGTSNMTFVGSVQFDPWFKVYSAIDERHAAYMACGLAAESGEPVVLNCTGATASRNYLPALTEAYYRKLPILVVTSAQPPSHAGNLYQQFVDRSNAPVDAIRFSTALSPVLGSWDARNCELLVNKAILEMTRPGREGPVHINLEFGRMTFGQKTLPKVRKIERFYTDDKSLPPIAREEKIVVFIGSHKRFTEHETAALKDFLVSHQAVVLCDATSMYRGERNLYSNLICTQISNGNPKYDSLHPDLILHIGEHANDYGTVNSYLPGLAPVWRISMDGELRDRFGRLEKVFEMSEAEFFKRYSLPAVVGSDFYYKEWLKFDTEFRSKLPELPFSNLWIGSRVVPSLPEKSVLHLGMSTSFQTWSTFLQETSAEVFANVGACGIDGCVSTLIGAALCDANRLHYLVVGDLAFFYDLNALGNRHLGPNVRILLVNNGCAGLFHVPGHPQEALGDSQDAYLCAKGHFGSISKTLVKHYAEDLGFEYLSASSKEEFNSKFGCFVSLHSERPILFECFTEVKAERMAWALRRMDAYKPPVSIKDGVKKLVPSDVKNFIKGIIR